MLSKATLIGRLGSAPELRSTPSGAQVCSLSLACDVGFGDKKQTSWHKVIAWQKLAENLAKYCKKGSVIFVEGDLIQRSYDDKTGTKKYVTEIQAREVRFLSHSNGNGSSEKSSPEVDDIPW